MKNKKKNNIFAVLVLSGLFTLSACQNSAAPIPSHTITRDHQQQMMIHLQNFQDIAFKHGGNRAVGTAGGQASARYILAQAQAAGFEGQMLPFENRAKVIGHNILVKIAGKNKHKAILIGAHYDSVAAGPGINDNASGVAVLLELLHQFGQNPSAPEYTIVFAFWDSEEQGLAGSTDYVKKLSHTQLQGIKAYINVDMVGAQNPTVLISDVNKTSVDDFERVMQEQGVELAQYHALATRLREIPHHTQDEMLEQSLKNFLMQQKAKVREDVSTLISSDSAAFLGKVPVASMIFVNEQLKGDELEFVPCYHKACDTLDLIEPESLHIARQAVLHLIKRIEKD